MERTYKNIARVRKAHGKKGEVLVHELPGLPFLLEQGATYCLVPPALKRDRFCTVESLREAGDDVLVKFKGYDSIADAEELEGKYVLADTEDLELSLFDIAFDDLIGRSVADTAKGDLGSIVEVMESPAHDIWVVDGPYGEVLIPAVEAIVLDIPEDGAIEVVVPDGLIEGE